MKSEHCWVSAIKIVEPVVDMIHMPAFDAGNKQTRPIQWKMWTFVHIFFSPIGNCDEHSKCYVESSFIEPATDGRLKITFYTVIFFWVGCSTFTGPINMSITIRRCQFVWFQKQLRLVLSLLNIIENGAEWISSWPWAIQLS